MIGDYLRDKILSYIIKGHINKDMSLKLTRIFIYSRPYIVEKGCIIC